MNAIGFNQLDGYIYGMKAGSNNTVMKIDANGVGYDLGAVTGLPLDDYIAGDVDANGILYVKSLVGTTAYGIDVNYSSPNYLTVVKTITGLNTISGATTGVQDFAFHPTNGKLYTIQGSTGKVYEISWPTAGASVAAIVVDRGKPTNLPIGTYGAIYFASDGSMYGYSNGTAGSNNGAIYRMTNVVGTGLPVATPLTTSATGVSSNDGARCPLAPPVLPPADVLLLKRITAINGLSTNPNDNTTSLTGVLVDSNWKADYVVGATDGGPVKPGDTIEYTIYYLNNGGRNAKSARICDRLNAKQSFQPNTYTTGVGMQIQIGGDRITNTAVNLTNQSGDDGGQFIAATSPVNALPTNCNSIAGAPNNDYGALILDLVTSPGSPNLTTLPGKTSQGAPNNSFGFWRFITKVNKVSP